MKDIYLILIIDEGGVFKVFANRAGEILFDKTCAEMLLNRQIDEDTLVRVFKVKEVEIERRLKTRRKG